MALFKRFFEKRRKQRELDLEAEFIEAFNIDTFKRQLKCKHSKQELHLGTKIKATYVNFSCI